MAQEEFTIKEVVIEIKQELSSFRQKYDEDQARRDDEMSKRPTRTELYGSVAVVSAVMSAVISLIGG